MASIKYVKLTMHCPKCHCKLFSTTDYHSSIGRPFMHCSSCDVYLPNQYQQEWYNYKERKSLWIIPLIAIAVPMLLGLFIGQLAIGVISSMILMPIILIWELFQLKKICDSKKRMRSKEYLKLLKSLELIAPSDFRAFYKAADLP